MLMAQRTYAPNRIKELRKANGYSLERLGAEMRPELTASTVAKLENGKMALSLDYLKEVSRILQVPPSEIFEEFGAGTRVLPIVGRTAAGNWREAVQMSDSVMPVPGHLRGKNLFVLEPEGDSMDKIVPEGAAGGFIVVDPDQRELVDRKFYVVMNGENETTFKRFNKREMCLEPCSKNPEHQPIPVGSAPFVVIGRVVYVGQEL